MVNNHHTPRPMPAALYQNIERMDALNLTVEGMKGFVLNVTQEVADEKQELECKHYGTFMTHLSRSSLEALFWVPFTTVFVLLILAAISHQKSERTYMHGKHHPEDKPEIKLKQRHWRIYCVIGTTIAAFLVIGCVIFEAFAGCALTYCSKHKLIWFYWGMWTLTQVGSLIAIIGVAVHQWACLGEHSTPPWNVALGTPILVITGIAHITGSWFAKRFKEWTGSGETAPASRSTYNPDRQGRPFVVAYKLDGGVIMEFPSGWQDPTEVPGQKVLGHNEYGGHIIEYPPAIISPATERLLAKMITSQSTSSNTTLAPPSFINFTRNPAWSTDIGNRENEV